MKVGSVERDWSRRMLEEYIPRLNQMGLIVNVRKTDESEVVDIYQNALEDISNLERSGTSVADMDAVYAGQAVYTEEMSYNMIACVVRLIESPMRRLEALRRRAALLGIRTHVDEERRTVMLARPSAWNTDYSIEKSLAELEIIVRNLEDLKIQRIKMLEAKV